MNRKLDLAQAEAVADVINSRSDASLRGARNQLDGILSQKVDLLREELVNISSLLELELDFAEEDLEFVSKNKIKSQLQNTITEIEALLKTYSFGRVMREGVNVALVGKPNVGKSSLLNYILKESRAIVSSVPGTTRDVIREEVSIDGILFRLFDTAGIRLTEDSIEKEGVVRSRETVENADVVIFISDVETGFDKEIYSELKSLADEKRILKILNKIDLGGNAGDLIPVSALTGEGMEQFFAELKKKAMVASSYSEKSAVVSNLRHYNALKKAKINLENALESLSANMTGEFLSVDLRNAENSLGEIIGKVTTDDILNNIFSKFCVGK
jgi:tRNA modification GTPase